MSIHQDLETGRSHFLYQFLPSAQITMAMALRPIDNALPIAAADRQKKLTKGTPAIQKQPDLGVNDENKAPTLESQSTDASIDYISSENLKEIIDPEIKIQGLMEGLESKEWTKVCGALNDARRFALFHSNLLLPNVEKVIGVLVKSMKNPRSALCKTSIMASADIFSAFGGSLLDSTGGDAFDQLLLQLLLKASQDKRFVCEEADKALNAMVDSMKPLPLLCMLQAYVRHANMRIRAKSAISISNCISKMGLDEMEEFGLSSLVHIAADLLNDRLPEAREAARSSVIVIYKAFVDGEEEKQEAWKTLCQSNLPPLHAQSLIKITSSQ